MTESDLRRKNANALHIGDVVMINVDGYGHLVGRISGVTPTGVWLENGMGGKQWARFSEVIA